MIPPFTPPSPIRQYAFAGFVASVGFAVLAIVMNRPIAFVLACLLAMMCLAIMAEERR